MGSCCIVCRDTNRIKVSPKDNTSEAPTTLVPMAMTARPHSFAYNEGMTHLHMVIDNLNPISLPHHENRGFTTHLKHLTLMSSSPHHHATTSTQHDLSLLLVATAPRLRTLDIRGINRQDSAVVHTMLKHVVHMKLLLRCEILESMVQNDKRALSPNIETMHVTFGAVTPSVTTLLALWMWATSKCGHTLYCVITKWTEDFETLLKQRLAATIEGHHQSLRLFRFDVDVLDPAFDDPLGHRAILDAWHMFLNGNTNTHIEPNPPDSDTQHTLQDTMLKITQSPNANLRLPWKTLDEMITLDENALQHNISGMYLIFGTPVPVLSTLKGMIALWKWATSSPGRSLHCVINHWRTILLPPFFLENALKNRHLIHENRMPVHAFRFALSEFTLEMQDALCPKTHNGILLHAWDMFFMDRVFTKVRTNLSQ